MVKIRKLKKLLTKKPKEKKLQPSDFLSTGSTVLNLACTDTIEGGLVKGTYHNLVGDSDTGKSVLAMTILAEAYLNPEFEDYELVYNNAERAKLIHLPILDDRLVMVQSNSPEDFYYDLDDRVTKGPVVYILDSMDSLIAKAADKKFKKQKAAKRNQKEEAGSYGTDKAKVNAANLNRACSKIGENGSILVIISQTHDKIGTIPMFGSGPRKTRSGGHALKFYNRWEVWLSVKEKITRPYKSKKVQMGTYTTAKVEKNHITGKKRTVIIPIYNEYGVDDVGGCIEYLIEWEHWKGTKETVNAPEFGFKGSKKDLIKYIEAKRKRIRKLRKLVGKIWEQVEDKVALKRKLRYV